MREFTTIMPQLFQSQRYLQASSGARELFLYLLAGPHSNSVGCFRVPAAYVAHDLQRTENEVREWLDEIERLGLIDRDGDVIKIERWMKHSRFSTMKFLAGAQKAIDQIPSDRLRSSVDAEFSAIAEIRTREIEEYRRSKAAQGQPEQHSRLAQTRLVTGRP